MNMSTGNPYNNQYTYVRTIFHKNFLHFSIFYVSIEKIVEKKVSSSLGHLLYIQSFTNKRPFLIDSRMFIKLPTSVTLYFSQAETVYHKVSCLIETFYGLKRNIHPVSTKVEVFPCRSCIFLQFEQGFLIHTTLCENLS